LLQKRLTEARNWSADLVNLNGLGLCRSMNERMFAPMADAGVDTSSELSGELSETGVRTGSGIGGEIANGRMEFRDRLAQLTQESQRRGVMAAIQQGDAMRWTNLNASHGAADRAVARSPVITFFRIVAALHKNEASSDRRIGQTIP
jgi:hypothetical protein